MTSKTARSSANFGLWILAISVSTLGVSTFAQSRRYGGAGVTVYTNPNFSGESVTFRDDTPDLRGYSLNDKISSIETPNGETWEVCQDINYENRYQVLSGSVSDLRSMGWNDRISSLRRINNGGLRDRRSGGVLSPNRSQRLVVYDRPGFRGNSTVVTAESNVWLGTRLGSVEVRGGTWELCDRTRRCATVSADESDLAQLGLSGRITSARRVSDRRNNGQNQPDRRYDRDRHYGK